MGKTRTKKAKKAFLDPFWLSQRAGFTLSTGADYQSRRLYLTSPINDEVAHRFLVGLHLMQESSEPITIILNSGGGEEQAGYAIYDSLRMCEQPVVVIGIGQVMSIATLILQGAKPKFRILSQHTRFMVHNGTVDVGEIDQGDLKRVSDEVDETNAIYHKLMSHHTGLSLKQVEELCEEETHMNAEEAVVKGFADAVLRTDGTFDYLTDESTKRTK